MCIDGAAAQTGHERIKEGHAITVYRTLTELYL